MKTSLEKQYDDIVLAQEIKKAFDILRLSKKRCISLNPMEINYKLGLDGGHILGSIIAMYIDQYEKQ